MNWNAQINEAMKMLSEWGSPLTSASIADAVTDMSITETTETAEVDAWWLEIDRDVRDFYGLQSDGDEIVIWEPMPE